MLFPNYALRPMRSPATTRSCTGRTAVGGRARVQVRRAALARGQMYAALVGGLLAGGLVAAAAPAQAVGVEPGGPFAQPHQIRFAHMAHAQKALDYYAVQVRRVIDLRRTGAPQYVGVREELLHKGARPGRDEVFDLRFLDVENRTLTQLERQQRERLFRSHAGFLHEYQSFAVFDAALAESNYRLQYLGFGLRSGRPIFRMVVWPYRSDRGGWIVDLDQETGYPLYRGEYNHLGLLVGEVEVLQFAFGVDAKLPTGDSWGWQPRMGVQEHATAAEAVRDLQSSSSKAKFVVPESATLPPGYRSHRARVMVDVFTGERSVVLVYTDGVDSTFVAQKASTKQNLVAGNAIGLYSDGGMTQCVFYHGGVEYLIMGRTAAQQVRSTAAAVYAQAAR